MKRLSSWLVRGWAFIRELSGEAALERRMQAHHHKGARCALDTALSEIGEERPRCC
jgi:hypothetical protein